MPFAPCPECDEDIRISGTPKLGKIVVCPQCGTRLEVVELDPLELDWAFDEPEDWDDEESDYEDEDDELDWEDEEEEEEDGLDELGLEESVEEFELEEFEDDEE
jgi:lysine biosynthesis protein LysW